MAIVEASVPIQQVGFFQGELFVPEGETDPRYNSWHGEPSPYLDTEDGDGSYGQALADPEGSSETDVVGTFLWEGPGVVQRIKRVEYQIRPLDGIDTTYLIGTIYVEGSRDWNSIWQRRPSAPLPVGSWTTVSFGEDEIDEFSQEYLPPFINDGGVFVSAGGFSSGHDVSMIRLIVEVETTVLRPLRQIQRDDGLGRGTVRARGGTSRQASIRQRGYF